ncbi:MAG: hypothetical protein QXW98_06790 [Candidatus Caldarchaeum sp.]
MASGIPFKKPELKNIQPKNNQGSGIEPIDRLRQGQQSKTKDRSSAFRETANQNVGGSVASRERCRTNLPPQESSSVAVSPDRRPGLAPSGESGKVDKSDKSFRTGLSNNATGSLGQSGSGVSGSQSPPNTRLPKSSGGNYVPPTGGDGGLAGGSVVPPESPGADRTGGRGTSIPGGGGIPSAGGGGSSSGRPISPRDLQSPPSEPLGGSPPSGGETPGGIPGGTPGGQPSGPGEPGSPGSPEDDNVSTIVDLARWPVPIYVTTFVPFTGLGSEFGDANVRLDTYATSSPISISDIQPPFISVVYPVDFNSMPNAIKCKPQYFISNVGWRKERISHASMVDFSTSESESIGGHLKVPICVVITLLRKDGNDFTDVSGNDNIRTLKRSYFLGTYDIVVGSQNNIQLPDPFSKAVSSEDMRRIRAKISREIITGYRMKGQGEIGVIGPWIGDYLVGYFHKLPYYGSTYELSGNDNDYYIGGTVVYEQEYPNVTPTMALFKRAHTFGGNIDNIDAMALYSAVATAYNGIKTSPNDASQWSRPYGTIHYDLLQVRGISMSSTSPVILVQALATVNMSINSFDGQWYISPMDDELLYQKDVDDNYKAVVAVRYIRYRKPLALLKIAYANGNGMPTSGQVGFTTFSYNDEFPFFHTAMFRTGIISPTNASFSVHVPVVGLGNNFPGDVSLQLDAYVRGDTQLVNFPSKEYHAVRPVFTKPMIYVDEHAVTVADGTDVAKDVAFGKIFISNPKPTTDDIGTYTNHAVLCLGNAMLLLGYVEPYRNSVTRTVSLRLSKYCKKALDSAKVMVDGVVVQPTNLVRFDGNALFTTSLRMRYNSIPVQVNDSGHGNVKISVGNSYKAYRPTTRIYTSTQNNKMGYAHVPGLPVGGSITLSQSALPKWVGTYEGSVLPIGSGSGTQAPQVPQEYQGHKTVGWLSLFSMPILEVQNDYVITRDAISLTPHLMNNNVDVMSSIVLVVSFPTYVLPKGVYIRNDANAGSRNSHIVEGHMVATNQTGSYTFRESNNRLLVKDTTMMKTYHQNVYSNSIYNDPNILDALKQNGYYIPIYIYTDVPAPFVYPDVDDLDNRRFYVWKIKVNNRTLIVRPIFPYYKLIYDDKKIAHFVPATLVSML